MSMHYLDKLFNPTSIAVIGASDKKNSVGMRVFSNLIKGKFAGKLYPVNIKHKKIQGRKAFASVKNISGEVDLAVITTPALTVSRIIEECGEKGVSAAVIISAGFSETGKKGRELEDTFLQAAHSYNIRLIGPNCLGIMRPKIKLNATFDNSFAIPGSIALVSQSGAICAAIIDWAANKKIGFSTMLSLGNAADIDFGEVLDFLALDKETKSILLYVEGIHQARRFMSGLRAASRLKPVIVIKGGRNLQGSSAAHTHTGALVGDDAAFDAALRQAGAVRVMTIEQLFTGAEILSSNYRTEGNRLAVITNGGGAGVMAADRASELNVELPKLSKNIVAKLNKVLPPSWSHQNPIDIIGDAQPQRYHDAVAACASDDNIDAILTLLVPVAMSNPLKVAKQVIADAKMIKKPILACWMGEKHVKTSWELFAEHNLPCFYTPEAAVDAFSYLGEYKRNQQLLLQVPGPLSPQPKPDIAGATLIIESVLTEHRDILTTSESKAILKAFSIPVTQVIETRSANEAMVAAESMGFPVVMKINSLDITHKSDVDGVRINITNVADVRTNYKQIIDNAKEHAPDARITGVTVERMDNNPNNRELLIGVIRDKVFGPIITFGAGGKLVEIMHDRSVALPPLNQVIARDMISKTRIAKMLGEFRSMPAVNIDSIVNILLRVSEMVCELPSIKELDINPLIANDKEVIAVDARIVVEVQSASSIPYHHMAICPYPNNLVSTWQLPDGTNITIRPIRPEDAEMEYEFVHKLSSESKYFRFMEYLQELTPAMLVRFTQIDYDREMALIATVYQDGKETNIGVARYIINPDQSSCEFALVIADKWHSKGIGTRLLSALIDTAKLYGLKTMMGEIFSSNKKMLELVERIGFAVSNSDDSEIKLVSKELS